MKLRKFKLSDAERVAALLGDKAVSEWTVNIPYPYSASDAAEWIKRTAASDEKNPFAVELNGELVACVAYWPHGENAVEVGYWVGKEYWGQGIATASVQMLLSDESFPETREVVAKVMNGNIGSERVLLNCGFEFLRECIVTKQGRKIDGRFFIKPASDEPASDI